MKEEQLDAARATVMEEHRRLREKLGLGEVRLEVYLVPEPGAGSAQDAASVAGALSPTPRYSGSQNLMIIPFCCGDPEPSLFEFPPKRWVKFFDEWPAWRIELWHEVVHQYSHERLHSWDPREAPFQPYPGRRTSIGHGEGWWTALSAVAAAFGQTAATFDELLSGE